MKSAYPHVTSCSGNLEPAGIYFTPK